MTQTTPEFVGRFASEPTANKGRFRGNYDSTIVHSIICALVATAIGFVVAVVLMFVTGVSHNVHPYHPYWGWDVSRWIGLWVAVTLFAIPVIYMIVRRHIVGFPRK